MFRKIKTTTFLYGFIVIFAVYIIAMVIDMVNVQDDVSDKRRELAENNLKKEKVREIKRDLEEEKNEAIADKQEEDRSFVLLKSFHRKSSGSNSWEIEGSSAKYFPKKQEAIVSDSKMIIYGKDNRTINIVTKQAKIKFDGALLGLVETSTPIYIYFPNENAAIEAKRGSLDYRSGELALNDGVKIKQGGRITTGKKLEGNLNSKEFVLIGSVQTVLPPMENNG